MQEVIGKKKLINETSSLIVETKKWRRLEEVFRALDSDEDGLISASKIEIGGLSPEVLEIITPLLCEMEELSLELDYETFLEAADKLFDTLAVVDKDKLLLNPKKQAVSLSQSDFSFKPNVNHRARRSTGTLNGSIKEGKQGVTPNSSGALLVHESLYNDFLVNSLFIFPFQG